MLYALVIRRRGKEQIGPPEDFDTTARNVAALFEEGYREVELRVFESRPATTPEVKAIVAAAQSLLRT